MTRAPLAGQVPTTWIKQKALAFCSPANKIKREKHTYTHTHKRPQATEFAASASPALVYCQTFRLIKSPRNCKGPSQGCFNATAIFTYLIFPNMSASDSQIIKARRDQNKHTCLIFSLISRCFDFQASNIVTYPAVRFCEQDLLSVPYLNCYSRWESPLVSSFKISR